MLFIYIIYFTNLYDSSLGPPDRELCLAILYCLPPFSKVTIQFFNQSIYSFSKL